MVAPYKNIRWVYSCIPIANHNHLSHFHSLPLEHCQHSQCVYGAYPFDTVSLQWLQRLLAVNLPIIWSCGLNYDASLLYYLFYTYRSNGFL